MSTNKSRKILGLIVLIAVIGFTGLFLFRDQVVKLLFKPTDTTIQGGLTAPPENNQNSVATIATGLNIPWEIAFLPNGDLLVTERPGNLVRVGGNRQTHEIQGVRHIGEGGLLGLALDPSYQENNFIYLYLTTETNDGLSNRVERYQYAGDRLTDRQTIIDNIPGSQFHDGGRIAFGPDGLLYITTGDAGNPDLAQDRNSLAGKILRISPDGTIPDDNPFSNQVFSLGHRNPQGLAWDHQERLWATEHGPSGTESGNDEVNLIVAGGNYGWPFFDRCFPEANQDSPIPEPVNPKACSGDDETWAPAGMAYLPSVESLFFVGLRGETLYQAKINANNQLTLTGHFRSQWGRLRAAAYGPDGNLYIATSNRDGRGDIKEGDDKIIRINPSVFE